MSYSQHIQNKMPRKKNEFNIATVGLYVSGLLIYLELKIKSSFLRIIKKTLQFDIFGYIFINRI